MLSQINLLTSVVEISVVVDHFIDLIIFTVINFWDRLGNPWIYFTYLVIIFIWELLCEIT